ncbi:hypothetical protein OS493_003683 [Desmophyllum pertusum]|uniref:Uncharacterized protein n=1 Tax=Desmophyllum pertusum TaxID=174260 RepID=A0A9X0A5V5_9CNID|nr:hypothetical protein OS493_003683 [Desmophyllum pertusum]
MNLNDDQKRREIEVKVYSFYQKKIKHQVDVVHSLSQEVREILGHLNGLCQVQRFNQPSLEKQQTVLKTLVGIREHLFTISDQCRQLQTEEQSRYTEEEELGWTREKKRQKHG